MTNEEQLELIAQARELLKQELDYHSNSPHAGADVVCRLITTHLAEMDEHKGVHTDYGYVCQKCSKSFFQTGMSINQYPCNFIITKAKRLLGVE